MGAPYDHNRLTLCAGDYAAHDAGGTIVVFARGVHDSAGYRVFLERDDAEEDGVAFSLWHFRLTGPDLKVLTPFAVSASVQTTHRHAKIRVRDSHGLRTVAVTSLPANISSHLLTRV